MIFTRSILFVCLMSGEIRAQYHTESWTTSNGLPQNSVLAILQTRDGYIWLTTNDGLLRFDGVKFTIFDSTNSPGLCCNRLTSLSEDSEGALWIGTDENKLVKYQNRRFTTFPTNGAYSIKKDRSGNFSITAYERHEFSSVHRAPALHFPDRSGADWYSDDRWLIRFKDGQQTVYQFPTNVKHTETIYEDEKGVLWIGTRMGLWRLQNGNLSRVAVDDKQPELAVTAIIEDNDGDFWIGTSKGLYQEQAGKFKVFDSTQGLANAFIRALYVDREELLWIGTDTKGLFKLQRTVITTYSQRDGLATDNVYPLFQDSRGRIWIGSWPRGITIYQNGKFERVKTLQSMSYKFPFAFYEDREGTIWIASGPGWCFKNGRAVDWPSQLSLQVYGTSAIIQDRSGAMWFGAENGLFRFFQGEITRYTKKDRLVDGEINVLLEDRQGAIWIGARNGLSRLSNARFTNYTVNNGLKSNHIRSLYEDEDGTIWVGTFDGGLSRIKDEKITTYMPHDGLFSKGAFQILDDDQGNLWLSSNLGIYRVSKSQLNAFADGKVNSIVSIPYGQRDGMRIPECNGGRQPAGFKSRDGKLWFPTVGGIAVVDVSKALARPLPPPLIIDRIEVADKMLNSEEALLIDFDENSLKIYYNCLSFMKPDAVNFRYIMEGLDRNWVDAGNRRIAPYPYLPPGRFRFRLAASIAGGEWNEFEKSIRITVPTPFWRSWWFVSLIILAVAIAGYFYYRGRVSTLVKRNAEQQEFSRKLIESQENERKKVARELHDDVVNDLASLAVSVFNLSRQVPQNADNLIHGMMTIHNRAMDVTENVRQISHSLHPASLQHLGLPEAIRTMCDEFRAKEETQVEIFIDESLGSIGSEVEICIYRVVQEALRNVAKHAQASSVLVSLRRFDDKVELIVSDDGVGFNFDEAKSYGGIGLTNMKERIILLGGELQIISAVGQGVEITAGFPLKANIEQYQEVL